MHIQHSLAHHGIANRGFQVSTDFLFVFSLLSCLFYFMYLQFLVCVHRRKLVAFIPTNPHFLVLELYWLVESSPHPHAVFIILISSFFLQCPQNSIFLGIEDTKWISEENRF
jgi:hypothetical protein